MRLPFLRFGWGLLLTTTILLNSVQPSWGAPGEEHLLILHNGGKICGIVPQIGGRIVVYRTKNGDNVLDARPALWTDHPPMDLTGTDWKQYYGESVWAGPQADWGTAREPYPPPVERKGTWPPDPAWETAPFSIVEQSPTRVVLRSPISKFTGLELTKTIELLADGQLYLHEQVVNRGDRVVTRDLWLLHRVSPTARSFLPSKSATTDGEFSQVASLEKVNGLTVLEPLPQGTSTKLRSGKMRIVPEAGWMATTVPEGFFTVNFHLTDAAKTAPGQAPVEIFVSTAPKLLCEMEHHGELKTLQPGEGMESEESWQIVPYTGASTPDAQTQFLQKVESSPTVSPGD